MATLHRTLVMRECPTAMCHAPTMLRLADGGVLIAWFGGSAEGADDVGIYLARGANGAFDAPRLIAQSDEPHWNPVLFAPDEKTIALYYKVGRWIRSWRTMVRLSDDGGHSFSEARELVPGDAGGRGPVRAKPIRLMSGEITAPASTEDGPWRAFVDLSEDNGAHWRRSSPIAIDPAALAVEAAAVKSRIPVSEQSFHGRGVIQPTLWESAPGVVHALMRSTEGRVFRADSTDGGRHFTEAFPTDIPNPNSGIDVAQLEDGRLVLAHNPVADNWGARSPMRLSISRDNGRHFETFMDLDGGEGEFAYPAILADGGHVHVCYTYKRQNIAYWAIDMAEGRKS